MSLHIDHVTAWYRGITDRPNECVWLVAADHFEEEGDEAFAATLRNATNANAARSLIYHRYFGFRPSANPSAQYVNWKLRALTPVDIADTAGMTNERFRGTIGRRVRVVTATQSHNAMIMDRTGRMDRIHMEPIRMDRLRIPMVMRDYNPDGPERGVTVHCEFRVGLGQSNDSPMFVEWPIRRDDVWVQERVESADDYAELVDVTTTMPAELFDGVFDKPTPTDDELDAEVSRRAGHRAG